MDTSIGEGSLFLCPVLAEFSLENISSLVSVLQEIGFISQPIKPTQENSTFFTGKHYLDYIAYMGCSPAIQFESTAIANGADNPFCHVKIHLYDVPELIVSKKQSRAPHCPKCSKPVKNWETNKTATQILCDQCNTRSNIAEFNWRKMAGYGRVFIEITDIFPKEAIPQALLLDKLRAFFATEWQYFYACQ